jgi:hypothetical protein
LDEATAEKLSFACHLPRKRRTFPHEISLCLSAKPVPKAGAIAPDLDPVDAVADFPHETILNATA